MPNDKLLFLLDFIKCYFVANMTIQVRLGIRQQAKVCFLRPQDQRDACDFTEKR